jgi:predicted transcriptional regulator of viral defense system
MQEASEDEINVQRVLAISGKTTYTFTGLTASPNQLGTPRTLSRREAELVSWLEVERPKSISLAEISSALNWPQKRTYSVTSRLVKKHWLRRTRAGHYEPLLGESAGILVPDPWVALTSWEVPHYIALASAAYEHNLNPDRPGAVQVCVPVGTTAPTGWRELAITLVPRRAFQLDGSELAESHGVTVRLAGIERVLLDSATMLGRVGGVFGLARIVDRGREQADWRRFAELAEKANRGVAAARRIAALLEVLGQEVPPTLAKLASASKGTPPLYLGSTRVHGRRGEVLPRWRVQVNLSPETLREEVGR